MPLDINTLVLELNGSAMAVAGHAEFGFIAPEWFLAIPEGANLDDQPNIGTSQFGAQLSLDHFMKANFHHLRAAAGSDEAALFITTLRVHLVQQGVLTKSLASRAVVEDEYVTVAAKGDGWNHNSNDIPDVPSRKAIAAFVKRYGNTLIHQMVYVFSARGHHWDPAYNELYDRLRSACFISGQQGFQLPSNEVLYRLSIHAFGIKILTQLALWDKANNSMSAAMALRFSPSAPIAGMAHITTLDATIRTMRQEPWFHVFEAKFHENIVTIQEETALVHQTPYEYHVASKVFGYNARKHATAKSLLAFAELAQYALGYIDHLGRRHSLSGQQAITSKSGGPRGISDAFAKACDRFGKPSTDVESMAEFLANV
jgi:hypothetical protein